MMMAAPVADGKDKDKKKAKKEKKSKKSKSSSSARDDLKAKISTPFDFRHTAGMKLADDGRFEISNLKPEWLAAIHQAGISDDMLRDEATRETVLQALKDAEHAVHEERKSLKRQKKAESVASFPTHAPPPPPVPAMMPAPALVVHPPNHAPPPPPPPSSNAYVGGDGRSALMDAIRNVNKAAVLKHVEEGSGVPPPPPPPPPAMGGAPSAPVMPVAGGDGRSALLDQIRNVNKAAVLRKVGPPNGEGVAAHGTGGAAAAVGGAAAVTGLAGLFAQAFKQQREAMGESGSDEGSSDEDEEDDW
ncbi:hypothetical protein AMAG_20632 [Allomyces macrogynus ATCC 38327]|uniref:WH2 domain-containing protein n=1 Tax=Allomyces macrogynus (strain ATCC 38327) TaxID=578462 RepID=A0A0L0TDU3_ALLM3|nr:hypothetical protein AMAG_20632 [Allomyces macrogynus ATCC 38327]|eukprot:KNE72912.1 hypothetical protein AMAG_20632 [Allomyces macrogynus ATCC 38327]